MSGYSGQVQIARTQYGFKVTIPSQMAFAPESSQIQQEVLPLLGVMTGILKKGLFSVGIAGYTSSHPINETGLSDWELSGNRSSAIMRYFKETGNIAATRLASVGYGQYRPATSESSGNENDRLELNFVIREDVTG